MRINLGTHTWNNQPSHGEISQVFIADNYKNTISKNLLRAVRDVAGGHDWLLFKTGSVSGKPGHPQQV